MTVMTVVRWFLMGSGCTFWILVMSVIILDIRMRLELRRNKKEWPEPVFDTPSVAESAAAEMRLRDRLEREGVSTGG